MRVVRDCFANNGSKKRERAIDRLGLSESPGVVVIAEGRILKETDRIQGEVRLNVMQAIAGG